MGDGVMESESTGNWISLILIMRFRPEGSSYTSPGQVEIKRKATGLIFIEQRPGYKAVLQCGRGTNIIVLIWNNSFPIPIMPDDFKIKKTILHYLSMTNIMNDQVYFFIF
jgi:hypothetical protein